MKFPADRPRSISGMVRHGWREIARIIPSTIEPQTSLNRSLVAEIIRRRNSRSAVLPLALLLLLLLLLSMGSKQDQEQEQEQEQEADLDLRLFSNKNSRFRVLLIGKRPGLSARRPREKALRQGYRFEHRLGFVDGFLKLGFRHRIVDPAAAGLHVRFAVF